MNTQSPLSATESLGVMLSLVRAELVRSMEDELAASGLDLSYTQFLILKKLAKLGPMSASNLARTVELDGGAMTRQLDQLERKDYLRRCPHEQDRRALRIELTEAGAAQSQQLTDCSARVLEAAQRSLSETERNQLHDYLTRVLHALRDKN
ncbi:MAG TPA: MarR family transcriptional regulator [Rhodanobacter sp.]|jgi:DNA-binding MarR family transcriptional regulator|nr:MarR family transcriptional regulator [Rhodanobacter sp.]